MDTDKIKQFFVLHVEKIIFAFLVAVSAFLIYQGTGTEIYTAQKDPDRLRDSASSVSREVDVDHVAEVIDDRVPTFDILVETEKVINPVAATPYKIDPLWPQEKGASGLRRRDIDVPAPTDLIAVGTLRSIAIPSRSAEYPLTGLEGAEAPEQVEQEVVRPPAGNRRGRGRGRGRGMMDDMDMDMGMEDMDMGDMDMEMGMGMETTMSMGPNRKLDPKFDDGIRPTTTTLPLAKYAGVTYEPRPAAGWFISVIGLMPHKELHQAFRDTFDNAQGFNFLRDRPTYVDYEVARADVTDKSVDQLVEADWVVRGNMTQAIGRAAIRWCGVADDYVPNDYRDLKLSGYIPPVLVDEYASISTHPKIPMAGIDPVDAIEPETEAPDLPDGPIQLDNIKIADAPTNGGFMGGMGRGMESDMDMDMGMDMGMGRGGMSMRGGMIVEREQADHKIMRFYDFFDVAGRDPTGPRPGRTYVYRFRVAVEDPNFPKDPRLQPKSSQLAPEVYERVNRLKAQVAANPAIERPSKRWGQWSQPSPKVALPDRDLFFSGNVKADPPKTARTTDGRTVRYSAKPPEAKMVFTQFNFKYATWMPFWMDVTEGQVIAAKGDVDVIDPVSLAIKKMPEQEAASDTLVLDIEGGQPLAAIDHLEQPLRSPGEFLMFDAEGGLSVVQQTESQENYRRYGFADERGIK